MSWYFLLMLLMPQYYSTTVGSSSPPEFVNKWEGAATSTNTLTISGVTAPSPNGIDIIWAATVGSAISVGAVTVNGAAVDNVNGADAAIATINDAGTVYRLYGFYKKSATTGNVVINTDDEATSIAAAVVTYQNVNQSSPFGSSAFTTNGDAPTSSSALALQTGDLTIDAILFGSGSGGFEVLLQPQRFSTDRDPSISIAGSESSSPSLGWSCPGESFAIQFAIGLNKP